MIRPTPAASSAAKFPRVITDNPRVHVVYSPGGTVTLVGVTVDGDWVAEYRCYVADFNAKCILAMERKVMQKERESGPDLHIV